MNRTPEAYAAAFEAERKNSYPVIDALETRYGYAIDRELLESAARVLACPLKRNPPNWQHGRVVYALARHRLAMGSVDMLFESGTAKGFATVCMAHACWDAGMAHTSIWSRDIIDPNSAEPRNSVMDGQVDNIWGYVRPFLPPAAMIAFTQVGDDAHFVLSPRRISFAFVDGAHTFEGVKADITMIVPRQREGDLILFDDFHLPPVADAVLACLPEDYVVERVKLKENREYAIAVKAEI